MRLVVRDKDGINIIVKKYIVYFIVWLKFRSNIKEDF